MAIRHVQAHPEKGAWRGIVYNERGDLLTRTVNTYPTSAAALTAAERLWDARCSQRDLLLVEGAATKAAVERLWGARCSQIDVLLVEGGAA